MRAGGATDGFADAGDWAVQILAATSTCVQVDHGFSVLDGWKTELYLPHCRCKR